MKGSLHFIDSIISVLLFIGFGVLRGSLVSTYHNELAANIAGIGMWLACAYIGFNMIKSPETSILYRLNRRWTPAGFEYVSGIFILLTGLIFTAFQVARIIEKFSR